MLGPDGLDGRLWRNGAAQPSTASGWSATTSGCCHHRRTYRLATRSSGRCWPGGRAASADWRRPRSRLSGWAALAPRSPSSWPTSALVRSSWSTPTGSRPATCPGWSGRYRAISGDPRWRCWLMRPEPSTPPPPSRPCRRRCSTSIQRCWRWPMSSSARPTDTALRHCSPNSPSSTSSRSSTSASRLCPVRVAPAAGCGCCGRAAGACTAPGRWTRAWSARNTSTTKSEPASLNAATFEAPTSPRPR